MLNRRLVQSVVVLLVAALNGACSSSDSDTSGTGGSGAGTGGAGGSTGGSAGTGSGGTGGSAGTAGTGATGGMGGTAGTAGTAGTGGTGQTGTLAGDVTRSAAIATDLDGVGTVYIGVFDEDPLMNMGATPIGNAILENADLSTPSASVPYSIASLPVGPTLYVVPFQDDDGNATPGNPVPASGDILGTEGGTALITVTLTGTGQTQRDLDLNTAYP